MSRRKRNVLDSDDDSDVGSQSAQSDKTVDSSRHVPKKKATARKRGRTPGTTMKGVQQSQDDSDDDNASSPPNSPQNASSDLSEVDSSDSNYVPNTTNKNKRSTSIPLATNNKKQRVQKGTSRDSSPQPSTSYQVQIGIDSNAEESESDSADSDYGLIRERNFAKKKQAGKRQPQKTANKKLVNSGSSTVKKSSANTSLTDGSQMNASQRKSVKLSQTSNLSLDLKQIESLAQKLVNFSLVEDQKKYAIRRKAIVTHVFKDEYSPKLYSAVIKKANELFKKVYGMELIESEHPKDSYIVINNLSSELGIDEYIDLPRIKQQQRGLILFLLTVIYMNDNVITEDELTKALKPLGIDLTSKRLHPVFGDVKKYITTELVKQMYLNYECISKEPPRYEFTWGLRAKKEVDKKDLLKFACTIMDDTSPEDWKIQFRDAEDSAKPITDT